MAGKVLMQLRVILMRVVLPLFLRSIVSVFGRVSAELAAIALVRKAVPRPFLETLVLTRLVLTHHRVVASTKPAVVIPWLPFHHGLPVKLVQMVRALRSP